MPKPPVLKAKPFFPQRISRRGVPVTLGTVIEPSRVKLVRSKDSMVTVDELKGATAKNALFPVPPVTSASYRRSGRDSDYMLCD
jgi:hypothetical protein